MPPDLKWFAEARYGLFIHYGLYSLLGRGEWALNREQIPLPEYQALAQRFTAERFDAPAICDLAVRAGMKYVVLTTMHHDGFRLYHTDLSDFCATKTAAGRDLVAELVQAARERGLRVGLYHSLNNWTDQPDAVAALEDPVQYQAFIKGVFARLRELATRFNPVDIIWYDGWWPFNAEGWQAEAMNEMLRGIQPHLLFNGRNCLPGDFATPEQHLSAPRPWRPFEACVTLNDSWGWHAGDNDWKSPRQVADMLITLAQQNGNLLLNVGPRGDGSIPTQSVQILETVGEWLGRYGEGIYGTEPFTLDPLQRGDHRGDWSHFGAYTVRGNSLYLFARRWPGRECVIGGLEGKVLSAHLLGCGGALKVSQESGRVRLSGLPAYSPDPLCPVIRLDCDAPPSLYLTGGLRPPNIPHPRYDPKPADGH